ncbi:hypothetical protein [Marinobacter shengliensis]|uniref:Uncharacterized protein n=1 Tax=Marinobacter shengliensis TaxID=1389223 RepID=A0ABV4W4F6_9GAMM
MKFSMNGFRRQLSEDVENLRDMVRDSMNGEFFDREDLVEAMNNVITHSNVINCVYQKDDPEFVEIHMEVDHLEMNPEGDVE